MSFASCFLIWKPIFISWRFGQFHEFSLHPNFHGSLVKYRFVLSPFPSFVFEMADSPEMYRSRVLELNASDERGINVIRTKVKDFAQLAVGRAPRLSFLVEKKIHQEKVKCFSFCLYLFLHPSCCFRFLSHYSATLYSLGHSFLPSHPFLFRHTTNAVSWFRGMSIILCLLCWCSGYAYPCPPFKVIILDEADAMTVNAQTALRRVIEEYSRVTRFCILCNYISRFVAFLFLRGYWIDSLLSCKIATCWSKFWDRFLVNYFPFCYFRSWSVNFVLRFVFIHKTQNHWSNNLQMC